MFRYEQNLHINDDVFEGMRTDADNVIQKLIKNMVEKESFEGKVTITINIALAQEFIMNRDPNIEGETRRVLTPSFNYKVGSTMQITNEAKGSRNNDGSELVWDEESGEYVLKPIANTEQMSIFDIEFQEVSESGDYQSDSEPVALEGRKVYALPEPDEDDGEESVEEPSENDADDNNESQEDEDVPFSYEDDYRYEDSTDL